MSVIVSRPRGRPPSDAARRRALAAAHEILMNQGFGRVTIDAVSALSGVGKPTIYRNWANASELAMAALMEDQAEHPGTDESALADALARHLRSIVQAFSTTRGRQIGLAIAAADPESEMTRAFRNRVVLSGREAGRGLISAAVARGELTQPQDFERILDMIYAPIFYRLLVRHGPLDAAFADGLAAGALALLRPKAVLAA